MNGRPLPMLNGFTARLIVPGWYATNWVKSLEEITVNSKEFGGFWMKTAYWIPDTSDPNLGGLFFGDYIGISARGTEAQKREAYIGFTYNDRQGSYFCIPAPQQDNNLSKITY